MFFRNLTLFRFPTATDFSEVDTLLPQVLLNVRLEHGQSQVEHVGVEHVPGTNLLLDHVEAGLFDVHVKSLKSWGGQTLNFRRQTCATGA